MSYKFEIPKQHRSIIKVVGVGGGGSNAVNHMYKQGIADVEFVVCNTDAQALRTSPVPNKLQIGTTLTEGLGAGANPEKGRSAAMESKQDIRDLLAENTKMLFVTAGMGGGTGTGAAPVIAQVARELDILTVGIVTMPFAFEGRKKMRQAEEGIRQLKEQCDTVLVIMNDRLKEIYSNMTLRNAFALADNVLTTGAKSIAEIITKASDINVDFEDVKTVMKDSGAAVMGSSVREGEGRALRAAEEAISSPLLNSVEIHGAKNILLSMASGPEEELTMDELTEITSFIQERCGEEAEVIWGHGIDEELENAIRVTVVATGFHQQTSPASAPTTPQAEQRTPATNQPGQDRQVMDLDKEEPQMDMFQRPINTHDDEPTLKEVDEPEEEKSYGFAGTSRPVEKEEQEEPSFSIDLDGLEVVNKSHSFEENAEQHESLEAKKQAWQQRAKERAERKDLVTMNRIDDESLKDRFNVPAYKRQGTRLREMPHSSQQEISRYNLNDDNQLLGNNKFLHDNVD